MIRRAETWELRRHCHDKTRLETVSEYRPAREFYEGLWLLGEAPAWDALTQMQKRKIDTIARAAVRDMREVVGLPKWQWEE